MIQDQVTKHLGPDPAEKLTSRRPLNGFRRRGTETPNIYSGDVLARLARS